jgi:glyoxylase-like metal-dependent hydrolase (beta-lactamase superfamily II)
MRIGSYSVDLIETCRFALDGGAMFGVVPKNLWARAYPHVDEQNRIAMAARALLIRGAGRTVVVDAGCGHKMGEKLESIYALDHSRFTLRDGLAAHGVAPEDVTDFIYTHLHFDHAGGSTIRADDGTIVPLFPNARHYVQAEQLAWARNPTDKDRASFMPENWEPVAERGLLLEVEGTTGILRGLELRPMHGHTRAMQLVIVYGESDPLDEEGTTARGLVYMADLAPTAAHVPFPYIMGYDNFPLTTLEEKKAFIPEAYERNWLLCFEHDAFTDAVLLGQGAKGFAAAATVKLGGGE